MDDARHGDATSVGPLGFMQCLPMIINSIRARICRSTRSSESESENFGGGLDRVGDLRVALPGAVSDVKAGLR